MIAYSIALEENILHCNIFGEIKLVDFTDYINKLIADEKYHPKLDTIIKICESTTLSYANEAAGVGRFFSEFLLQRKGVAWAFVMSSQTTMGLTRLVMEEVDTSPINVGYFFTESEAKKWIAELKLIKKPEPI